MFDLNIDTLTDFTAGKQPTKTYKVPPAGMAAMYLVSYVELGQHKDSYKGEETVNNKVELVFELHGKNYPVENGNPMRITVRENLSYGPKSNFLKLFNMLKGNDNIKHPAQLVGKAFKGRVFNTTSASGQTFAVLKPKGGFYEIGAPTFEDPETGEVKTIKMPAMISDKKIFVWSQPTKATWDSLYIDGVYADGNSKNVIQNKIRSALNYNNSYVKAVAEGCDPGEVLKVEVKKSTHFEPRNKYDRKPVVLNELTDNLFGDDDE